MKITHTRTDRGHRGRAIVSPFLRETKMDLGVDENFRDFKSHIAVLKLIVLNMTLRHLEHQSLLSSIYTVLYILPTNTNKSNAKHNSQPLFALAVQ